MERPTTFDELQASAERELARLEEERGQREAAAAGVRQERERLRARRDRDRRRAVACAVFGFIWQMGAHHPWFLALPGLLLVAAGVAYWARSRGWG